MHIKFGCTVGDEVADSATSSRADAGLTVASRVVCRLRGLHTQRAHGHPHEDRKAIV